MRLHWSAHYLPRLLNLLGYLLLYCAVFLYEDDEGKIQNRIEQWWIHLDDARVVAHSRAAAFLQEVARLTVQGFDCFLGKNLASLRFVGVSFCLSIASLLLLAFFGALRTRHPAGHPLFASACFVAFALVPGLNAGRWIGRLWGLGLLLSVLLPISSFLFFIHRTQGVAYIGRGLGYAALAFGVSFACDVSYVALTRWMLRKISTGGRLSEAALMVAVNLLILFVVVIGPVQLGAWVFRYWQGGGAVIILSFCLNAIDFFAGSTALLLALSLLIHRVLWPILEHPLYALQRYQVISNKKLLWGAGLGLAFLPTQMAFDLVRPLLEKVGGALGA